MNYFEELTQIDVSKWVEEKNGLKYVSWANAWGELKKRYPTANYKVYEREDGVNYFTDGRTAWVKVSVTVRADERFDVRRDATIYEDIEHIEYLPVMDFRNRSIPLESITSMDVNKAIQRALTKAIARHGLGLFGIYAGEDLPAVLCSKCGREIKPANNMTVEQIVAGTTKTYGAPHCMVCSAELKMARLAREALEKQTEIPVEVKE